MLAIEARLPDDTIPIEGLSREAKAMMDLYQMHIALGLEVQGSDESDGKTPFKVRSMNWQSKDCVK